MKINNIIYKLICTSLFFVLLSISDKSFAFTVIPAKIELSSTANSQETFSIRVRNDEGQKVVISSYSWDWALNKNGIYESRPIGGFDYSLAKQIKTLKSKIYLEPHEMKEIFFTITVPDDIKGEKQALIYIQSTPDVKTKSGENIIFSTNISVPVYLKIKGTELVKSRIKDIEIKEATQKEPFTVLLNVVNEGNVHVKSSASISILSGNYSLFIGTMKTNSQLILPKREKQLKAELDRDFTPGKYKALITYQFDDKYVVVEKPFEIK